MYIYISLHDPVGARYHRTCSESSECGTSAKIPEKT